MTPHTGTPTPSQAQHAVRWLALTFLVFTTMFIALIARGLFDPQPCGPPAGSATPGSLALAERGELLQPQSEPFSGVSRCYAMRLTAAYAVGETDSGYGLAVGDRRAALVVAVSPLGQAAVWQTIAGDDEPRYLMPWQPWPHVRPGIAANEIWLDVRDEDDVARVTARINRELLWEGEVERLYPGAALWLGSFGGPVSVDFQTLDWFAPVEE
jgi:hypothetical protein